MTKAFFKAHRAANAETVLDFYLIDRDQSQLHRFLHTGRA